MKLETRTFDLYAKVLAIAFATVIRFACRLNVLMSTLFSNIEFFDWVTLGSIHTIL